MPLTHYEILGLTPTANFEEIKRAYRRQALHWHPDRNPNNPKAHRRFIAIKDAYAVLSNPERRAYYDAVLRQREQAKQNPPPYQQSNPPPQGQYYRPYPPPPPQYRKVYRGSPQPKRGWGSGFGAVFLVLMLVRVVTTCNRQSYSPEATDFQIVEPAAPRPIQGEEERRLFDSVFGYIGPRDSVVSLSPPILKRYMAPDSSAEPDAVYRFD